MVNVKFVDSLTSLEQNCADTKFHVHVYSGVMVIQLVKGDKEHGQLFFYEEEVVF